MTAVYVYAAHTEVHGYDEWFYATGTNFLSEASHFMSLSTTTIEAVVYSLRIFRTAK